jgi:murein DD-endopeptidase MepM/ murein hydrolase activator NlpD
MTSLARPAACAALALALVPAAARADTSNIVFPVAGPVLKWHDDYGARIAGTPQRGNAIGVAAGTPVVATAAGRVSLLWRGSGGWSITLTTPTGDQFVYLHLGKDGNRRTAYLPGLKDGASVKPAQRLGWSGFSGAATATSPQLGFQYLPRGGEPVDPYELLASARRLPAAARPAPTAPGKLRLTGVVTWSVRGDKAALLRVRTATIVRDGGTRRVRQSLMLALAADAAIAHRTSRVGAAALVPGLRVTVWATARKGGSLVANRVRIEQ